MIRAAFIGPCIGIGGGDMLMAQLVRHAQNIEWTGVLVHERMGDSQIDWCQRFWDHRVPIHTFASYSGLPLADCCTEHDSARSAYRAATKDADIIISWCQPKLYEMTSGKDKPIIEYVQNTDKHAQYVVEDNKEVVTYKAACSIAAGKACYEKMDDVRVIYNGIDPSRITPRNGREVQRKVWGIRPENKIILYMGRFVKEKHPEKVIEALQYLPEEYNLIMCGSGEMQPNLYDLAKATVPNRVAFVEKQFYVGDLLAASDCFVLPSDYEGHPLAVMEAMLAGTHCVYTNLPVMEELHEHFGPIGEMIPIGFDVPDLAQAIEKATDENDETHMKRANARASVWNNFCISTISAQWEEYLEDCVNKYNLRRRLVPIYPVTSRKPEPFK